jgi:hypothetical protein
MPHYSLFLLMVMLISGQVCAQDERYYRQIFTGELPEIDTALEAPVKFNISGPQYRIDLDGDKIEEIIEPSKEDGVDSIQIRSFSQRTLFEQKLIVMGAYSSIYKIKLVSISPKVKSLILFVDEGRTIGKRFESTARIFVLTYENNDLSKITFTEGPHFFHEKEAQREQYWRRDYNVNIYDINGDGVREISVQYNHIQRIMKYAGRGEWERI